MNYQPIKIQLGLFIDANEVIPSPDNLQKLAPFMIKNNLVSAMFIEPGGAVPLVFQRLKLISPVDSSEFYLATGRFDYVRNFNLEVVRDELSIGRNALNKPASDLCEIINIFSKTPHRLAFITSYFLEPSTHETFSRCFNSLFNLIPSFQSDSPFEWNWRTAFKKTFQEDNINVILEVARVSGSITNGETNVPFDKIKVDIDINTAPENNAPRFAGTRITDFFNYAFDLHENIKADIIRPLG